MGTKPGNSTGNSTEPTTKPTTIIATTKPGNSTGNSTKPTTKPATIIPTTKPGNSTSNSTKPTTKPITIIPTTKPGCFDNMSDASCNYLKSVGRCGIDWVKEGCSKTCEICTSCYDNMSDASCKHLKSVGRCGIDWVKQGCSKTCGICKSCDCKDLVDAKGEGNCKGSINKHFGKVICYVEQPTSCSDAHDSVVYAGEKYSALACTVGVDNGSSQGDATTTDAPPDIGSTNTAVDNGSSQGDDATTDAPPDIGSTNTADLTTEMYTTHSYMSLAPCGSDSDCTS